MVSLQAEGLRMTNGLSQMKKAGRGYVLHFLMKILNHTLSHGLGVHLAATEMP